MIHTNTRRLLGPQQRRTTGRGILHKREPNSQMHQNRRVPIDSEASVGDKRTSKLARRTQTTMRRPWGRSGGTAWIIHEAAWFPPVRPSVHPRQPPPPADSGGRNQTKGQRNREYERWKRGDSERAGGTAAAEEEGCTASGEGGRMGGGRTKKADDAFRGNAVAGRREGEKERGRGTHACHPPSTTDATLTAFGRSHARLEIGIIDGTWRMHGAS